MVSVSVVPVSGSVMLIPANGVTAPPSLIWLALALASTGASACAVAIRLVLALVAVLMPSVTTSTNPVVTVWPGAT